MSSCPQHQANMKELTSLGLDLSEFSGNNWFDSWDYDSLVDIVEILTARISEDQDKLNSLLAKSKE